MKIKKRLDQKLLELYPQYTRNQIQSFIMQGKASIVKTNNGKESITKLTKSGTQVDDDSDLRLSINIPKYVCRAGFKLEKALDCFNIDVKDLIVLDAGLSTGGFTDCLLQNEVKHVYGIDVGHGQVHEKILNNPKVTVKERTNLRYLTAQDLQDKVDLVTLDLSFISLTKVIDAVNSILKSKGKLITLIKPQFEADKHEVGRGGIIKDPDIHKKVVDKVIKYIESQGFKFCSIIESPITGTYGNKEFLSYFIKN